MARYAIQKNATLPREAHRRPEAEDWKPLHPMHRRLAARLALDEGLQKPVSIPVRMAAIFYLAVLSWAAVAGALWVVSRAF